MKNIIGIGLVALDVLIEKEAISEPMLYAGGSCGNVLSILSYLGFETYPIARLGTNNATDELLEDIKVWGVNTDLITTEKTGSTPIIIQRLSRSADGNPVHRFEFRNPETGKFLPSFKPVLAKTIDEIYDKKSECAFFYIDRISRSSLDLARLYKEKGAIIIYEPSSLKFDRDGIFDEIEKLVDVIKFSNDRISNYRSLRICGKIPIEIETLGKDGIKFRINNYDGTEWKQVPSFMLDRVIDTAGAGDWCTAGIVKSLLDLNILQVSNLTTEKLSEILFYSQALAALSCMFKGPRGLMYQLNRRIVEDYVLKIITANFTSNDINSRQTFSYKSKFNSFTSLLEN